MKKILTVLLTLLLTVTCFGINVMAEEGDSTESYSSETANTFNVEENTGGDTELPTNSGNDGGDSESEQKVTFPEKVSLSFTLNKEETSIDSDNFENNTFYFDLNRYRNDGSPEEFAAFIGAVRNSKIVLSFGEGTDNISIDPAFTTGENGEDVFGAVYNYLDGEGNNAYVNIVISDIFFTSNPLDITFDYGEDENIENRHCYFDSQVINFVIDGVKGTYDIYTFKREGEDINPDFIRNVNLNGETLEPNEFDFLNPDSGYETRFLGYKIETPNSKTAYVMLDEVPVADYGMKLYQGDEVYDFFFIGNIDGRAHFFLDAEPQKIDLSLCEVRDEQGNEQYIISDYFFENTVNYACVSDDGKAVYIICVNEANAFVTYGKSERTIQFYFMANDSGYNYYMLNKDMFGDNFEISKIKELVVDDVVYGLDSIELIDLYGWSYRAVKIENSYYILSDALPNASIDYYISEYGDEHRTFRFHRSWEDDNYIAYNISYENTVLNTVSYTNFGNIKLDGVESSLSFSEKSFEYRGLNIYGVTYHAEGVDKDILYIMKSEPKDKITASVVTDDGSTVYFSYVYTDMDSGAHEYWVDCSPDRFSRDSYDINVVVNGNSYKVTAAVDEENSMLCFDGEAGDVKLVLNLKYFENGQGSGGGNNNPQDSGQRNIEVVYKPTYSDELLTLRQFGFWGYDSEGYKIYWLNEPIHESFDINNVISVKDYTDVNPIDLSPCKAVINGKLEYALAFGENGKTDTYYVLGSASNYDKCELVIGEKVLEMKPSFYSTVQAWSISSNSSSDYQILNQLVSNFDKIDCELRLYYYSDDEQPVRIYKNNDFVYDNTYIHGYKVFDNSTVSYDGTNIAETNMFALSGGGTAMPEYSQILDAYFEYGGKTYYFDIVNPETNGKNISFNVKGAEGVDFKGLLETHDVLLTVNYKDVKGKLRQFKNNIGRNYINNKECVASAFYTTSNGDPDYYMIFMVWQEDVLADSYIEVIDADYELYINRSNNSKSYRWEIKANPLQNEDSVNFKLKNIAGSEKDIAIKEIRNTNDHTLFKADQSADKMVYNAVLGTHQNIVEVVFAQVAAVNEDGTAKEFVPGTDQIHSFYAQLDAFKALDATFIDKIEFNIERPEDNFAYNYATNQNPDSGKFGMIHFGINLDREIINEIVSDLEKNDVRSATATIDKLMNVVMKEGTTYSRTVELTNQNDSKVLISYKLKNNGETQTVNFYLRKNGNYSGQAIINGKISHAESIFTKNATGKYAQYMVLSPQDQMSYDEDAVLELTGMQYKAVFADYNHEYYGSDSENNNLFYYNGRYYRMHEEYILHLYDLSHLNVEPSYGQTNSYESDRLITDLAKAYVLEFDRSPFDSYDQALTTLKTYTDESLYAYKDGEEYRVITKVLATKEEYDAYTDSDPAIYYGVRKNSSNYSSPYSIVCYVKLNKLYDIVKYNPEYNSKNYSNDTCTVSDENELIEAIKEYNNIKLSDNIELTKDLIINHLGSTLIIDLNGYDIIAGNNVIEVSNNSPLNIKNNSDSSSVISGSGLELFRLYGSLEFNSNQKSARNISVNVKNGTAFRVMGFNSVSINNANITAKTCVSFENSRAGNNANIHISNSVLEASEYGVYMNSPVSVNNSGLDLRNSSIDSDEVGVYINTKANFDVQSSNVTAEIPVIISGVYLRMDSGKLVSNAAYSDQYSYDKGYGKEGFSGNGAAIIVDSTNNISNTSEIRIDSHLTSSETNGPLVAEVREDGVSRISSISLYSDSQYGINEDNGVKTIYKAPDGNGVFIYGSANLLENIEDSLLTIENGLYLKPLKSSYYDENQTPLVPVQLVNPSTGEAYGEYYYLKPTKRNVSVSNYADLKEALLNPEIRSIYVTNNIVFDENDENTYTLLDGVKSNVLEVACGRSGKIISFDNQDDDVSSDYSLKGYTLKVTGDLEEYSNTHEVYLTDVNLENNNGPLIVVDGGRITLSNSVAESRDKAVEVLCGEFRVQHSTINSENTAIYVNNTRSNYACIEVSSANVKSQNGPAIHLASTGNASDYSDFAHLHLFGNWIIDDQTIKSQVVSMNGPAIKLDDYVDFHISNTELSGTYGIYAQDIKDTSLSVSDGAKIIATEAALYVNNNSTVPANINVFSGELISAKDTIVIDGKVSYYISNGKLKKGSADYSFVKKDKNYIYSGAFIESGLFSDHITNDEAGNNYNRYICKTVESFPGTDYPYSIIKTEKPKEDETLDRGVSYTNVVLQNSRKVVINTNNAISPAEAAVYKQQNESELEMVLSVKEGENTFDPNLNIKESIDISVSKAGEDKNELTHYQTISISISDYVIQTEEGEKNMYSDPEKLVVYHKHDGQEYAMKKVSASDAENIQEECYYISYADGVAYLNIVTKQFSEFGIAEMNNEVNIEELKPYVDIELPYADTYNLSEFKELTEAYADGAKLSSSDATIVYEGIVDTIFYSENELPVCGGNFRVTWYAKDNNSLGISGKGEKIIKIIDDSEGNKADFGARIYGHSISTEGDIALNFYVIFDNPNILSKEGAYAEMTDGIIPQICYLTEDNVKATLINGESVLLGKFTYRVAAKDIYKPITIRFFDTDNKLITLTHTVGDTTEDVSTGYSSSVSDYLLNVIENGDTESNLYKLCERMIEYCDLAGYYFLGDVVNVSRIVKNVSLANLTPYKSSEAPANSYVYQHGVSLVLESNTSINHYFRLIGDVSKYTFTVNGQNVKVKEMEDEDGDNYYILTIPNIPAKDLDEAYTVTVTHEDGNSFSYTYSALSYAYLQLKNGNNDVLINLCKSIYLYNEAANTYFASKGA